MGQLIRTTFSFAIAFALTMGAVAYAQSQPSGWHEIRVIRVKAEMVDEFRQLQVNGINPALKAAGVPYRAAWRYVFGDTYEWQFVTPIAAFSQYDDLERVDVSDDVSQQLNLCILRREVRVSLIQRDLTKPVKSLPIPPVAIVTQFRLAPGTVDEYRELVKDYVLPAMSRIDAPGYEVHRFVFGGKDEWFTTRLAEDVAEIDKGPSLRRGLDDDTYSSVVQRMDQIQADVERRVMRLDAELSFFPEPPPSGQQ